nr:MAG TPA: hypothetical protein [Caudoviricetes sp.]
MVVKVDRKGDVSLQERFPKISNTSLEHLIDIEMAVKILFGPIAPMGGVERTQVLECRTRTLGILVIVNVDVIPFVGSLLVYVHGGSCLKDLWIFEFIMHLGNNKPKNNVNKLVTLKDVPI